MNLTHHNELRDHAVGARVSDRRALLREMPRAAHGLDGAGVEKVHRLEEHLRSSEVVLRRHVNASQRTVILVASVATNLLPSGRIPLLRGLRGRGRRKLRNSVAESNAENLSVRHDRFVDRIITVSNEILLDHRNSVLLKNKLS